jgi:outer membrane immunogenic protein
MGTGDEKLDWLSTARRRLGWLPVNSLLVYATGGLAYGHVQTSVAFSEQVTAGGERRGETGWLPRLRIP